MKQKTDKERLPGSSTFNKVRSGSVVVGGFKRGRKKGNIEGGCSDGGYVSSSNDSHHHRLGRRTRFELLHGRRSFVQA